MFLTDITDNFETLQITRKEKEVLQEKVDELTLENKMLQQEKSELERLQDYISWILTMRTMRRLAHM